MSDLIRELELLAVEIEWPPTPALRVDTAAAEAPARRRRARWRTRRRLIAVVALGVLLAAAAALAATGVIHLGSGVRIQRVQQLPPLDPARNYDLGRLTTLARARRSVSFPIVVPPALGKPEAVYVDDRIAGGAVTLVYQAGHGLPVARDGIAAMLTEFKGNGLEYVQKLVGSGVRVERLRVGGAPGVYVRGRHAVEFFHNVAAPEGQPPRASESALLWLRDGVTYRLELDAPQATALRLASGG